MDVWTYFQQKEREFKELSLALERPSGKMFAEEQGSNGKRGRIFGNLVMTDRAYLRVHEVVVVENDHVHRLEYGYFLVIDDAEVWGYERDPSHDPAVHQHVADHERETADSISFKATVDRAWDEVTARAAF